MSSFFSKSRALESGLAFSIIALLLVQSSASLGYSIQSNSLSDHFLPQRGCYRDELNPVDQDYYNCWMDNAGKILVMSALTNDTLDATRSLSFVTTNFDKTMTTGGEYYLPELEVISNMTTVLPPSGYNLSISNQIIELTADNFSKSHFDQLAIGTSYTGNTNLAYLGADRLWYNNGSINGAFSSISSVVNTITNGFSKRSMFDIGGDLFYTYTNATLAPSLPYANVSVQLESANGSSDNYVKYIFLQAFNSTSTNPFYSGTLYSSNGTFVGELAFRNASGMSDPGILLSYSNATNVFTSPSGTSGQDAVAIRFDASGIYDWEHWALDSPFGSSWFGPGYSVQSSLPRGVLTAPLFSEVYPILHFDYRLANDTIKYLVSSKPDFVVSPPVSFGFISYGLALEARATNNASLLNLARGYWNYYYAHYSIGPVYSSEYARSVNLLLLAGFTFYGCNSTVENFARTYLNNSPASSIEEFGWGSAAAYRLQGCTGSSSDISLYNHYVRAFLPSNSSYVEIKSGGTYPVTVSSANYTYQYAEAASGLMLAHIPYNNSVVISLMNEVYNSNVGGIILNQPYPKADLANTETLPAYMLATALFQNEMKSTGYFITGLDKVNITSIQVLNDNLIIRATGVNGTIAVSQTRSSEEIAVNGLATITLPIINLPNSTTQTTSSSLTPPSITTASNSNSRQVSFSDRTTMASSASSIASSSTSSLGGASNLLSAFAPTIVTVVVLIVAASIFLLIRRR